jgi:hypothetical protein
MHFENGDTKIGAGCTGRCPHCLLNVFFRFGNQVASTMIATTVVKDVQWWIGICSNQACGEAVMVGYDGKVIYPTPTPEPSDPSIPTAIAAALDEAKTCFVNGCFLSSALMSRRSVEITCKDKGATFGGLLAKIDALKNSGVITADLADWAHTIRHVGNDAAHDLAATVSKEDAADILELAKQLLQVVYVTPAVAASRRAARGIT